MSAQPATLLDCPAPRPTDAAEPSWFGDARREQFGWWHAPEQVARGTVVLVPALGFEAICAHRAWRAFARALAAAGFGVLRYDHSGTGDSGGDDREPPEDDDGSGWTRAWRDGVEHAVDAAMARLPGAPVAVIGLRMGATLAAAALARRPEVTRLVLVAPCATGRGFLRELRARHAMLDLPGSDAASEPLGFALPESTRAGLGALDLRASVHPPGRRVLIVERDDAEPSDLERVLVDRGVDAEAKRLPGFAAMMRDPHRAEAPELLIAGVRQWLEREPAATASPACPPRRDLLNVGSHARERPLRFGADGRLFGILTTPSEATARRSTGIVLLNAGATHHVGPSRLWVQWARAWAALGYPVLRFDLTGLGDSDGGSEPHPYPPQAHDDVRAALTALRDHAAVARFVVGGLCSGACHAFGAALDCDDVAGALMINPVTLHFTPGMSLDIRGVQAFKRTAHYKRALFAARTWSKLLRRQIDVGLVWRSVRERVRDRVAARVAALRTRGAPAGDAALPRELRTLAARGVDLQLVFSQDEPGLDRLARYGGRVWRRSLRNGPIRLTHLPDADHTLTPVAAQRLVYDRLTQALLERHG